jgi:hypothetical protein
LKDIHPEILGEALYDPYVDTPLVVPNYIPTSIARLREILDMTMGGKVALFVFYDVNDKRMMSSRSRMS